MAKINTVLYDFDGTIMDTNILIMDSWQHTFRKITGKDGDPEYIRSTYGEILRDSMKKTFPDFPVENALEIYRDFQKDHYYDYIQLFDGVEDLMLKVRLMGLKAAIATSRLKPTTMIGVEKFDLMRYVDAVVTMEDVSHHKPHPETILKSLEKLGRTPEEAIMLGDTKFDILCARNAGVKSVLVGWTYALKGMTMEDFAEDEAPDHIIHKPEELLEIISQSV